MHASPLEGLEGAAAAAAPTPAGSLIAVLAGAGVAWGALSYVALTIGVLAEGYGFTLNEAAALATLELAAMAAASMSGGRVLECVPVRHLALAGGLLAGLANGLSALTHGGLALGVLRVAAGVGLGWMAAGLNTAISQSRAAQRLFIQANFGCIALAAAFFAAMPELYGRFGWARYFEGYGALCVLGALAMQWLPRPAVAERAVPAVRAGRLACGRVVLFLAVSVIWLCYAAIWSLTERFGRELGLTERAVGHALGMGTLSGLLGAALATALAGRVKPRDALIGTCLASGLCYVWMGYCTGALSYTAMLSVWGVVFCPILAYAYAMAAQVDPSGALARWIGGGTACATALGPILGARLAQLLSYRGAGLLACLGTACACGVIARLLSTRER
ncbi:MAG TPA: MFS transporter [Steroidobacteraceae bacterium]|nr:MFS transporter [Steroidobacteraceae bacterium]